MPYPVVDHDLKVPERVRVFRDNDSESSFSPKPLQGHGREAKRESAAIADTPV